MFHDFDFKIKVINFYDFHLKQNIKTNKKNGEVAKHPSYLNKITTFEQQICSTK
jgi:hypothetical protein|tara:strand:- start:206 stop:367 length:162 start_codon:yes stop_codon:yes gene_type:complete